jgi:hypothetical protein
MVDTATILHYKSNTQYKYTEDISEKDDDSSEPDIVYTAPTGKAASNFPLKSLEE